MDAEARVVPSSFYAVSSNRIPRTIAVYCSTPINVTNAEKLALVGIALGQLVRISNGFIVSGAGSNELNDILFVNLTMESKSGWNAIDNVHIARWNDTHWDLSGVGDPLYSSDDNVDYPYQVTTWSESANHSSGLLPLPVLVHPVTQRLIAFPPSNESNWETI